MDFTNINDPAGIKSLLDQLRQSQAWQETITPSTSDSVASSSASNAALSQNAPDDSTSRRGPVDPRQKSGSSSTVASLLSQLQFSQNFNNTVTAQPTAKATPPVSSEARTSDIPSTVSLAPVVQQHAPSPQPPHILPSSARKQDVRWLSFQQALPQLARLSEDSDFVSAISKLKQEQSDLERKLFEERRAIQKKHEEKVKVARTKASIVGGLSRHEADMMTDAFRRELQNFDKGRVLTAWDGLVTKQQGVLENLEVPAMFITDASADRERQQRVMQVLEGIAGGDET